MALLSHFLNISVDSATKLQPNPRKGEVQYCVGCNDILRANFIYALCRKRIKYWHSTR